MPNIWIIDHFNVKRIKVKNNIDKRYIYLAYIKNKHLSPTVEKFKEFTISNRNF